MHKVLLVVSLFLPGITVMCARVHLVHLRYYRRAPPFEIVGIRRYNQFTGGLPSHEKRKRFGHFLATHARQFRTVCVEYLTADNVTENDLRQ